MSEETTNQTKHRLNDDFADINASYQDYCHNKQAGMDCSSIKTHIMKAVYELFNKSRYKKYIPKLSVEICGEVARCLNNYEEYDKKEYVSFSQLVWYDIVNYVINPNKAALDDDREIAFDKFKSTTKYKIYKLSKFIDLYYQERHKTPDFSNPIVFSWFKEQLNWTEKQLKLIIQYYNIQNKRDASLDDSDKPNNINNVNDDNNEKLYDTQVNPDAENPQDIISVIDALKISQDILKKEKSAVSKERIPTLFTWYFLKNMHRFANVSQFDLFNEYTIFDQDIISRYFAGEWDNSSFDQKDIAAILQIDTGLASRTLKTFLNKVAKKIEAEEINKY